jgi:hypothetical protein
VALWVATVGQSSVIGKPKSGLNLGQGRNLVTAKDVARRLWLLLCPLLPEAPADPPRQALSFSKRPVAIVVLGLWVVELTGHSTLTEIIEGTKKKFASLPLLSYWPHIRLDRSLPTTKSIK